MDQRVIRETPVRLDLWESLERWDPVDLSDQEVAPDPSDHLVCPEVRAPWDPKETRELLEPQVPPARPALLVKRDPLDLLDLSDLEVSQEPLENLDCPVCPDPWDLWATQEAPVRLDLRETLVPAVCKEPSDTPALVV